MDLIKKHPRAQRGRRGQIMVILALAGVALVGIAALGIDVFYMYWNKNRLQGGTDAAALAGVTYFSGVTFIGKNGSCLYATDAQNAACTYALSNGILLSEITGVVANVGAQSMTVSATRSVPALFAKVVGIQNFTVNATSVAVLQEPRFRERHRPDRPRLEDPLHAMDRRSLCTMEIAARAAGTGFPCRAQAAA